MNTLLKLAAVLSVAAAAPTLADHGAARARSGTVMLVEANGPSPGGHDTALLADAESSGPTSGGRDLALLADSESSGPTRGGRDAAMA